MTKEELLFEFLREKAQNDSNFYFDEKKCESGYFKKEEFNNEKYSKLYFKNGFEWGNPDRGLGKKYKFETERKGNKIISIRLSGKIENKTSNVIKKEIVDKIKKQRCVVLGTSNPEVDHKNGWKNEKRIMENIDQKLEDFQPLSKAANDAKRQFCKNCKKTKERYDAKKLGYPISYYKGNKSHDGSENGCVGCFWYDPIEFRKHLKAK